MRLKATHNDDCTVLQPLLASQNDMPLSLYRSISYNACRKLASGMIHAKPTAPGGVLRLAPGQVTVDKHRQLAFTRDEEKSKSFYFAAMAVACALLFLMMLVPRALAQTATPTPPPCAECKLPEEPAAVDNLLGAGLVLLAMVLARKSRKTPDTRPPSELDG